MTTGYVSLYSLDGSGLGIASAATTIDFGSKALTGITNVNGAVVGTPLTALNAVNAADAMDIGFYGLYTSAGAKYAAFFRDASDSGKWKLVSGLANAPTNSVVDLTGGTLGELVAETLTATTLAGTLSTASQPNVTTLGGVTSLRGFITLNSQGFSDTFTILNNTTGVGLFHASGTVSVGSSTTHVLASIGHLQAGTSVRAGTTTSNYGAVGGTTCTLRSNAAESMYEMVCNTADASGVAIGRLEAYYERNSATHNKIASIQFTSEGATANQRGGRIAFFTKLNGSTSYLERFSIDNTGLATFTGNLAATLSTASQPNITTLGGVTSLRSMTVGATSITAVTALNSITVGTQTLANLTSVTSTAFVGTLSTASQPNITTLGGVTSLRSMTVGATSISGVTALNSITVGTQTLANLTSVTATSFVGTVSTASQPSITTLGGVTSLNSITVGAQALSNLSNVTTSVINVTNTYQKNGTGIVAMSYAESSQNSITTNFTWTHGLGGTPDLVMAYAVCVTTSSGYAVGDRLPILLDTHVGDHNFNIYWNSTTVGFRSSAGPRIVITRLSDGGADAMVVANWRIVFQAWRRI